MGIREQLESDRALVRSLFDEIGPLARDDRRTSDAMRLVIRLAIAIKTHALAEEKVIYRVIASAGGRLEELALEGPHAHRAVDVVLDKALALRPGADLRAALAVARRLFDHQADFEARELLPALLHALPASETEQLGRDLADEQARLRPLVSRIVGAPARAA